tara:strand:+ start:653 stop:1003 length:351 start_codon:yes stop_codon:yes gene_type:complete
MTDISKAIKALRPNSSFGVIGDRIKWNDPDNKQPTKPEIDAKIVELKLAEPMRVMRRQRDQLLKETDVYMVTDHPTSKADEWKTYRQELRDMPSKETPLLQPDGSLSNVTWPTKPE